MNLATNKLEDARVSPFVLRGAITLLVGVCVFLVWIRCSFDVLFYPWLFPDSYDWLWNAFAYSQETVAKVSHRGMLFTLLGSFLYRGGLEDLLPLFGTVGFVGLVLATYFGTRRFFGEKIALVSALFLGVSSNTIGQSAYVGCDVAATAFLTACMFSYLSFLSTKERSSLLLTAVFFALGLHTQYIGVMVLPFLIISFFISWAPGTAVFTTRRAVELKREWRAFVSPLVLATGILFGLLLPRWWRYHLLYEEKVKHGELVQLAWNIPYYSAGMLSVFSWPMLLFAFFGVWRTLRDPSLRRPAGFLLGWFFSVFLFFALLYRFVDVRFLIYLSPPVFIFGAAGVEKIFEFRTLPRVVPIALLASLILAAHVRTAKSWYANTFYIFPGLSFAYSAEGGLVHDPSPFQVPILEEFRFAGEWRREMAEAEIDDRRYSESLARLLPKVRKEAMKRGLPILVFDRRELWELYFMRNRNKLYAGTEAITVESFSQVLNFAKRSPIVLLIQHRDIPAFRYFLGSKKLLSQSLMHEGGWLAGIFNYPDRKKCAEEFEGNFGAYLICERIVRSSVWCSERNFLRQQSSSLECVTISMLPEKLLAPYRALKAGYQMLTFL